MTPRAASGTPSGSSSRASSRGAFSKRSIWSPSPQSISNSSVHNTSRPRSPRNQNSRASVRPKSYDYDPLEKSSFRLGNESPYSISVALGSKPDDYSTTHPLKQDIRFFSPFLYHQVKELEDKRKSSPLSSSIPRASLVNTLSLDSEADPISSATSGSDLLAPRKPSFLISSNRDKAGLSVSLTPPWPFKINNVDHVDPGPPPIHAIVTTAPSAPLVPISSLSPTPADRMGTTMPLPRTTTVTLKKKKGIFGFMTNFLNSNKRPEITTPHDLVHLTHIGFNSSTGELTGLPKEWLQLLQDTGIFKSKSDQAKNPPSVMDKMGNTSIPGAPQSPPVPGTVQSTHTRASRSGDDSVIPAASPFLHPSSGTLTDNSKRPPLSPSKKAHSSGDPQSVSSTYPAPFRPAPSPSPSQPVRPNLGKSTLQRMAPKPPRNDALVRANTRRGRRPPVPPVAVKAPTRISRTASTADLLSESQSTTTVNTPPAENRAPRHPTAPQQLSAAAVGLAKTTGATPRRREKKENKANDADIVRRLQQICTDADPTQLYRNLVKIGQG